MFKSQMKLVDIFLKLFLSIPTPIDHNLAKALTIKRLIWQLNLDQTEGSYVEFGTAYGHSLRSAELAIQNAHFKELKINRIERQLYAFDTFDGFLSEAPEDEHPTWNGKDFSCDYEKVIKRFKKSPNVHIYKTDVTNLQSDNNSADSARFEIQGKVALVLFDLDLYMPTLCALNWIYPRLQTGTYLMFDELYAFKGEKNKGETRAIAEFLEVHQNVVLEKVGVYGAGGCIFLVEIS